MGYMRHHAIVVTSWSEDIIAALYGERNPMSRLTQEKVLSMRLHRITTGDSFKHIAKQFGISPMTAYRAIVGQSWRSM